MSTLVITHNEHGTPVADFTCKTCGSTFTVTGGVPEGKNPEEQAQWAEGWQNCLGPECPSYDPNRDVDHLFLTDEEVMCLPVVGLDMLRLRKTGGLVREET